ncbi:MAG: hypothetical protein HOI67_07735 [Gammaproteobacteria bacterium]|nr:hypothetical protein [Gammaproteobacteria bacterium]
MTRDLVYLVFFLMLCLDAHAADWDSHGTFKTSGGELHYRVSGVGKPLLLLHDYCYMITATWLFGIRPTVAEFS